MDANGQRSWYPCILWFRYPLPLKVIVVFQSSFMHSLWRNNFSPHISLQNYMFIYIWGRSWWRGYIFCGTILFHSSSLHNFLFCFLSYFSFYAFVLVFLSFIYTLLYIVSFLFLLFFWSFFPSFHSTLLYIIWRFFFCCGEVCKLGFHCYRFWGVVLWMWSKCIVSTHTLWYKASWMLKALLSTSSLWTSSSS